MYSLMKRSGCWSWGCDVFQRISGRWCFRDWRFWNWLAWGGRASQELIFRRLTLQEFGILGTAVSRTSVVEKPLRGHNTIIAFVDWRPCRYYHCRGDGATGIIVWTHLRTNFWWLRRSSKCSRYVVLRILRCDWTVSKLSWILQHRVIFDLLCKALFALRMVFVGSWPQVKATRCSDLSSISILTSWNKLTARFMVFA